LKLLARAYALAPQERSVALLYAEAKLRKGAAAEAAALLEPFAASESDVAFLDTFADALLQCGQLDRSRTILEKLLKEKNEGIVRLFDLADAYASADQDLKSVEILQVLKRRLFADKKIVEFTTQLEYARRQTSGIHPRPGILGSVLQRTEPRIAILRSADPVV